MEKLSLGLPFDMQVLSLNWFFGNISLRSRSFDDLRLCKTHELHLYLKQDSSHYFWPEFNVKFSPDDFWLNVVVPFLLLKSEPLPESVHVLWSYFLWYVQIRCSSLKPLISELHHSVTAHYSRNLVLILMQIWKVKQISRHCALADTWISS